MPTAGGPNTLGESNLVFAYDTGDTRNSYIGQPTTNIGNNFRDFTGTSYSPDGEWTSNPTSFSKTYHSTLPTPTGPGGTLIEESGTGGYHHLSRYGGSDESGAHSLSCYIYPLVSGITDFCIGMLGDSGNNIKFNLDTRVITYGGGISNRNAFIKDVPGWPGWLRVGANFEGRGGGWVGCLGYSSYTSYTGTAGAKKAYITGIQYEYTTQPTPSVEGTRSATQGLLPLVGNSTIDLSNVSFDSNAQITFDGTDDSIILADPGVSSSTGFSIELVIKPGNASTTPMVIVPLSGGIDHYVRFNGNSTLYLRMIPAADSSVQDFATSSTLSSSNYHHVIFTFKQSEGGKAFYNGNLENSASANFTALDWTSIWRVGQRGNNTYFYQGELPVLKVYNRALSADEVKQNYQQYKTRFNLS